MNRIQQSFTHIHFMPAYPSIAVMSTLYNLISVWRILISLRRDPKATVKQ